MQERVVLPGSSTIIGGRVVFEKALLICKDFKRYCQKDIRQVTTNLIVAETYTFLRYSINYATAISLLNIQKSAESTGKLEVIYATAGTEINAVKLHKFKISLLRAPP